MVALPAAGSFDVRAAPNSDMGARFHQWLETVRLMPGGASVQALQIVGGAISPTRCRLAVDVEGGSAASDFLDTVNPGAFPAGALIVISPANDTRDIVVRNLAGNIVLKTAQFAMTSVFARLWLEYQPPNWAELAREYGQDRAQARTDIGIDGTAPVAGQPATYTHASGEQAAAGTAENAVMTPAAVAVALNTPNRVIGNKSPVTDRTVNDDFLIQRGGALFRMNILTLLATSFTQFGTTGEMGIGNGTSAVAAHGMGGQPTLVRGYYRCKTAEHGYGVGMEVPVECTILEEANRRVLFGADGINWYAYMSATVAGVRAQHRTSGAGVTLTNANWRFFMRMWR
ncbi:MAG: hypothetical protein RJA36_1453 [Pseudomonadota bacterium]|jgi:hypothetical protein